MKKKKSLYESVWKEIKKGEEEWLPLNGEKLRRKVRLNLYDV